MPLIRFPYLDTFLQGYPNYKRLSMEWRANFETIVRWTQNPANFPTGFTNPMTTLGDVIYALAGGAATRLGIGTSGQVLTVSGGVPAWATLTALTNPMTTLGDIIYGGASGTPTRLGIGSTNQILAVISGIPAWITNTALTNPMTTEGDIIYQSSGVPARLALGNNGTWLFSNGVDPSWQPLPAPSPSQVFLTSPYTITSNNNYQPFMTQTLAPGFYVTHITAQIVNTDSVPHKVGINLTNGTATISVGWDFPYIGGTVPANGLLGLIYTAVYEVTGAGTMQAAVGTDDSAHISVQITDPLGINNIATSMSTIGPLQ